MLRTRFRTIALSTTLVGTSAYLLYTTIYPRFQKSNPPPPSQDTFKVWVRSNPQTKEMRTFPLLPPAVIHSLLTTHVRSSSLILSNGKKWSWNVAQVASNDPIEDTHSELVITRGEPDKGDTRAKGELMFFAVMDGHAGPWTSQLLSKTLIPTVAIEMDGLIKGLPSPLSPPKSTFDKIHSFMPSIFRPDGSASSDLVATVMKRAFTSLDRAIISSPLALLESPPEKRGDAAMALTRPALSGSCALLALLDTHHEEVHVALAGDCRAVAGYFDPVDQRWITEVLSEDQTAKVGSEIERLKKEHPGEEEAVARNGRVLGGLEPSRAFGDAKYKWTSEQQEKIRQQLLGPGDRLTTPPAFKTPPYVTAEPAVTHRRFTLPARSTPNANSQLGSPLSTSLAASSNVPTLRFLILATDGLWDELTPVQAVQITSTHLARHSALFPSSSAPPVLGVAGVDGKGPGHVEKSEETRTEWTYDDRDTPAVCLIRNALGGSEEKVRRALSLRAPFSRRERDDITVTVVWWEESPPDEAPKAKL